MSIVHTLSLLALKEVLPTVVGGKIAEASTGLVNRGRVQVKALLPSPAH
jgi:hypothetical protein